MGPTRSEEKSKSAAWLTADRSETATLHVHDTGDQIFIINVLNCVSENNFGGNFIEDISRQGPTKRNEIWYELMIL